MKAEYLPINQMILKRVQFTEDFRQQYKYGLKLVHLDFTCLVFTDTQDDFNRWYDYIKRYCILTKFMKRYKLLTKMKNTSSMSQIKNFYKCYNNLDYKLYQTQVIDKGMINTQEKSSLLSEISIQRQLNHASVLKLVEVYEDDTFIYVVTDVYQGKDLKSHLKVQEFFEEKALSDAIYNLLSGLNHLHQKNIIHRDIRPDNIVLKQSNNLTNVCITNFRLALLVQNKQVKVSQVFGVPGYIAPEVLNSMTFDEKIDIFGLGVVMYQMMFQRSPFASNDPNEILKLNQ